MNKLFVLIFTLFLSTFVYGQVGDSIISAEDLCKDKIMTLSSDDLKRINPNELIKACQNMPLSDDFAIQMLSVVIGEPLLVVLDAFSKLSNNPHGMERDSVLLSMAGPLHAVFEAFNWAMVIIMTVLIFVGAYAQIFSWQKGDFKLDFPKWFNRHGPSRLIVIVASLPIIGWLTPLQFISLLIVIGFVFIAKFLVVYLFLASFLGESISDIKDYVTTDITDSVAQTVLMYKCDLEKRSELVMSVGRNTNSPLPLKSEIEKSGLYQCLVGIAGNKAEVVLRSDNSGVLNYQYKPGPIAQTEYCGKEHADEIANYGLDAPRSCGWINITLPDNINKGSSVQNAIALYANNATSVAQRNIAMSLIEGSCRGESFSDGVNTSDDDCLVARVTSNTYRYEWLPTEGGVDSVLARYSTPFNKESKREYNSALKKDFSNMISGFGNNSSILGAHINDLLAPSESELKKTPSVQEANQELRSRILNGYKDDTSVVGYSEVDVDFLVDSMKRGAWASGGLFFGKLTEGIEKEKLADKMSKVYKIQEKDEFDGFGLLNLLELRTIENALEAASPDVNDRLWAASSILPRLEMYDGNYACWYDQTSCKTPPLNPFTYLSGKGASIMDDAINTFVISSLIYKITDVVTSDRQTNKEGTKIMIAKAIADFNFLYLLMGIVLVFVIPAMPLFKIMVMMINWVYDVLRELLALQITLCLSAVGEQGKNLLGQDVRASLVRLLGLGLYFLFMMIGVIAMFLIFSFLYSMNILVLGALSYIIDWTGTGNGMQSIVISVIFDILVTMILFYEIKKCTPYIEKFPMMLSENFGIRISNSSGVMQQTMQKIQTVMITDVSRFLDASLRGK